MNKIIFPSKLNIIIPWKIGTAKFLKLPITVILNHVMHNLVMCKLLGAQYTRTEVSVDQNFSVYHHAGSVFITWRSTVKHNESWWPHVTIKFCQINKFGWIADNRIYSRDYKFLWNNTNLQNTLIINLLCLNMEVKFLLPGTSAILGALLINHLWLVYYTGMYHH